MGYLGLGVAPMSNGVGTISGSWTSDKTLRPSEDCCSKSMVVSCRTEGYSRDLCVILRNDKCYLGCAHDMHVIELDAYVSCILLCLFVRHMSLH